MRYKFSYEVLPFEQSVFLVDLRLAWKFFLNALLMPIDYSFFQLVELQFHQVSWQQEYWLLQT